MRTVTGIVATHANSQMKKEEAMMKMAVIPTIIPSNVWRCSGCKAWRGRVPFWDDFLGYGEQCEKCGCTSVTGRPGRPFGPKSKTWAMDVEALNEIWDCLDESEQATVKRSGEGNQP